MKIAFLLFFVSISFFAKAQVFDADVTVNFPKLSQAEERIFKDLESNIQEFYNSTTWTDDEFKDHEKIKINIQFNIVNENSPTNFDAELLIQAVRPVYASNYESPLITHVDKAVNFDFEMNKKLQYSGVNYINNLSSVLSYYGLVILGLDYDSFSLKGGNKFYDTAKELINNMPSGIKSKYGGWVSNGSDKISRGKYIDDIFSPRVSPLREAFYIYHRQGLDLLTTDLSLAQEKITEALDKVYKVDLAYAKSTPIQLFANTKGEEILELYKGFPRKDRFTAYKVLSRIDGSKSNIYRVLKQ